MDTQQANSKLGSEVQFFFGDQFHGTIIQTLGEFSTNRKTNAFNKTDTFACQWAFLSALISLRDRAIKEGGNAVIGIKSNYKKHLYSSNDHFECGAGALMAGVALVGTVAKIE